MTAFQAMRSMNQPQKVLELDQTNKDLLSLLVLQGRSNQEIITILHAVRGHQSKPNNPSPTIPCGNSWILDDNNESSSSLSPLLFEAYEQGRLDTMEQLVHDMGVNPHVTRRYRNCPSYESPISMALLDGNQAALRILLKYNEVPGRCDTFSSLLHVLYSQEYCYLRDHWIDRLTLFLQCAPSAVAARVIESNLLRYIIESTRDDDAHDVAHMERAVQLLVDYGGNLDWSNPNDQHQTALHHAATWGSVACARILLHHGASIHVTDADGNTPLHLFCRMPRCLDWAHYTTTTAHALQGVQLLLQHYQTYNSPRNDQGETPLEIACQHGRLDIIYHFVREHHGAMHELVPAKVP